MKIRRLRVCGWMPLAALLCTTCVGGSPQSRTAAEAAPASQPPPAWLGTYDSEQQKVLAMPLDAPVQQAAPKTYPDLARFTFAGEAKIRVPQSLTTYANLVTQVLDQSPYLYVFRDGPDSIANPVALYGPAPAQEPDPWVRVIAGKNGQLSLTPGLPDEPARGPIDRARTLEPSAAIEPLREAAAVTNSSPGVHAMLGDAALATGDLPTAESAANDALKIDPLFPPAHRILAEVHLRRGDRERARASLAEALALYPASKRAWQVADSIVGREIARDVRVPMPFIEVNSEGAIVVVSCDRPMCQRYAGCKAAFRYEAGFREAVLTGQKAPYHVSATEEVVCLQAGLGAHLLVKAQKDLPPMPDPQAEMLIRLAEETGLTAYAMFEIVGPNRPEWLRVAPKEVHAAVVAYVLTRVLGPAMGNQPAAPPSAGVITAQADLR